MSADPRADRADIAGLVVRFDDAVNRRDADEIAQLWVDDAVWEIGDPLPMRVEGVKVIVAKWKAMVAATKWLFRGSFTGVIDVDGDRATGRWPCIETGTFVDGRGYDNRALYEDRYTRSADGWRFQHRRYLYLWLSNKALPGNAVPLGPELAAEGLDLAGTASALPAPPRT